MTFKNSDKSSPAAFETRVSGSHFKSILMLVLVAIIAPLCGCGGFGGRAHRPIRPLDVPKESICGLWIGFNEDNLSFYRLILLPNGKGSLQVEFEDGSYSKHEISNWTISELIEIRLEPDESPNSPIFLSGSLRRAGISSTLRGMSWKRSVLFRRKDWFDKASGNSALNF